MEGTDAKHPSEMCPSFILLFIKSVYRPLSVNLRAGHNIKLQDKNIKYVMETATTTTPPHKPPSSITETVFI